jgi:hypothetical protein
MEMSFWRTFFSAFINLDSYRDAVTSPLKETILYVVKFYLLLMIVVGSVAVGVGIIVSQEMMRTFPNDASLHYEQGKFTTEHLDLPWHLQFPAHISASLFADHATVHANDQEVVSVPITELIPIEQTFSLTHEDLQNSVMQSVPLAAATASIFVVLITAIGRIISSVIHAFIFSWILAAFGMQIVWRKLVQLMLHVTVTAETINLIALLIYKNTSFPMFETAFLGITLLVLRSLRRPSA